MFPAAKMLLCISVPDRLGLFKTAPRERQTSFVWCLSSPLLLSLHPSLTWDKFTANHERCQINLLWIEILQGWKEHCCSFLKQVLYLYSQANRRCEKDNSLKTWPINSPEKDKWYLIFFFSLDVEPATCPWCKAAIIIGSPGFVNASGFGLKHPGIPHPQGMAALAALCCFHYGQLTKLPNTCLCMICLK